MSSTVRDDVVRQSMMLEYILKIKLDNILHSDIGSDRAEVSHLRKSVDADKDDVEVIRE